MTVDDDRADRATALLQLRTADEPVKVKKGKKK